MVPRHLLSAHNFRVQPRDDSPKLDAIIITSGGKNEFLIQTRSSIVVGPRCEFAAKYAKIVSLQNNDYGLVVIGLDLPEAEVTVGIRGYEVGPVRSEFTAKDRVLGTSKRPHQGSVHETPYAS